MSVSVLFANGSECQRDLASVREGVSVCYRS